ncbi:hypothetical protein SO802_026464 [Lithocarpus litseifolius]|uniref:Uncharacterized protein n=1 Tax=Lithocarpus litseifolius TaxID=425828 RepID=A0AAW2BZT7_9ROSI
MGRVMYDVQCRQQQCGGDDEKNELPSRDELREDCKKATAQVLIIPTAIPPFGLGYKPTDDDLLEMELRRMALAKAKAKGLPCPLKPLKPYTPTLNEKFELLFDCNNKLLKLKKEDTNWVPTDYANYMDPDTMTTLLGDAIYNTEEEEYWEACQHALKSPYKARTSDKDEEGGEAPSDSDESSNNKSDSSSASGSSDDRNGEDDSNSDCESNKSEDYDSPQI